MGDSLEVRASIRTSRYRGTKRWRRRYHISALFPTNRKYRIIQREMAAEWLKLADAILHPLKRMDDLICGL
jgi:hypothetical protein